MMSDDMQSFMEIGALSNEIMQLEVDISQAILDGNEELQETLEAEITAKENRREILSAEVNGETTEPELAVEPEEKENITQLLDPKPSDVDRKEEPEKEAEPAPEVQLEPSSEPVSEPVVDEHLDDAAAMAALLAVGEPEKLTESQIKADEEEQALAVPPLPISAALDPEPAIGTYSDPDVPTNSGRRKSSVTFGGLQEYDENDDNWGEAGQILDGDRDPTVLAAKDPQKVKEEDLKPESKDLAADAKYELGNEMEYTYRLVEVMQDWCVKQANHRRKYFDFSDMTIGIIA